MGVRKYPNLATLYKIASNKVSEVGIMALFLKSMSENLNILVKLLLEVIARTKKRRNSAYICRVV